MSAEAAQPLGKIVLRTATAQDSAAVADLLASANAEHASGFPPAVWAVYQRDLVATGPRIRAAAVILAEAEGAAVGTVTLYTDPAAGAATLRLLAVAPDQRRSGVGRRLVGECCTRALASGCTSIDLHTAHVMHAAIRLYESMGFVRIANPDVAADQRDGDPLPGPDADPFCGLAYRRRLDAAHP